MKFTITRQNLHSGLAAVSSSIPSKTTLPVLSNILFETEDDGVWMSGTDLDVSVRVKVPAEIHEAGSLTAPGKKLQEITRELADQPVEISTRSDQIELSCGRSRFKLNGLPADEFPSLPNVDFEAAVDVKGKDLQSLIQHTAFAVSSEESRPILNGVLWELREGSMRMVATNGHRLARMGVPTGPGSIMSTDFIVPPAALSQVQRLFKDAADIQVAWDHVADGAARKNHLGFRAGTTEVYTRLIEGTYPNYDQVIPRKTTTRTPSSARRPWSPPCAAWPSSRRTRPTASGLQLRAGNRVHLNVLTPDLGEGHDELELGYERRGAGDRLQCQLPPRGAAPHADLGGGPGLGVQGTRAGRDPRARRGRRRRRRLPLPRDATPAPRLSR